jgi:hypothetical protein
MITTSSSTAKTDAVPQWLEWLLRWPGIVLALAWGFAKGTLFFILPDVPLSLAALLRPRRALIHLTAILAGAVVAGAVMFTWSSRGPNAQAAVARVVLVSPRMFERAERDYKQFGAWAALVGPLRGIPYKVYAVEAREHSGLGQFLLITVPARAWRLLLIWSGSTALFFMLRKWRLTAWVPLIHGTFWIVVYIVYWAKVK